MTKRDVNWDSVRKSNYETKAFWDIHWLSSARSLIASAKELEPNVIDYWDNLRAHTKDRTVRLKADHYQGPYFMLIAFAVENYFKAAIVRENSWEFKQVFQVENKFPKELKSHDLTKLAMAAHLDFTFEEEDLLRRLTRHAIWAGRYPVPVDYKKTACNEMFSNGQEYGVSWFGGNDVERLNTFVDSIEERLGFSRTQY